MEFGCKQPMLKGGPPLSRGTMLQGFYLRLMQFGHATVVMQCSIQEESILKSQ